MPKIVRNAAKYPHRLAAMVALLFVLVTIPLSGFLAILTITGNNSQVKAAVGEDVPFVDRQDVVVIGERKVCSFVGPGQTSIGLVGEDGGSSTVVGSKSYFAFGDVNTSFGPLPNTVATTSDSDAADCVDMDTKTVAGRPAAMLPKLASECAVWPTDMVNANSAAIHFFYYSFNSTCNFASDSGRIALGLGRLDSDTLETTRVNNFFWTPTDSSIPNFRIYGGTFSKQGNDVYVIWGGVDSQNKEIQLLSKVPASQIENKGAYMYWDGFVFQSDPAKMKNIWDQGAVGSHGLTIRFNNFINKWTAVYNTGYMSVLAMRVADAITGPWSGETFITKCLEHYPVSGTSALPCYGGKEHPQFQKNDGQIIYTSQSNFEVYQPFFHEVILGSAIAQWQDASGNAIYKEDSQVVSGAVKKGVAFYASKNPLAGFVEIHDWVNGSEHIYSASLPGAGFVDSGVAFYAPLSRRYLMAPIYRWDKGSSHRYSAIDLSSYGFSRGEIAFYGRITNYRIVDSTTISTEGSMFQIGVQKNGQWVQGGHLKYAKLSGFVGGTKYSIATNTPLAGNRFFGQNISADSSGNLANSGDIGYISNINLGVFTEGQSLDTSANLFGYSIKKSGVVPVEVGHQINPYRRAGNFKSFFLTGDAMGVYDTSVCNIDCNTNGAIWQGSSQFCDSNVTIFSTGATKCAKLSEFHLSGFGANTGYDVYYCSPNCEDGVVNIVYSRTSDSGGNLNIGDAGDPLPLGQFKAEYFDNIDFTNLKVTKTEQTIRYVWGSAVPDPLISPDTYSVRWSGTFNFDTDTYRFNTQTDGQAKVYVDGVKVIDRVGGTTGTNQAALKMTAGVHEIKVEYAHNTGTARMLFNFVKAYSCFDMTADGSINSADLGVVSSHFGSTPIDPNPWDVNGDKIVTSADLGLVASKFGTKC